MTHHIIQFTNLPDFIADLDAGETAAVYHQLIEQRTAAGDYGLTRWQLTTVLRAIVAGGRVNDVPIVHIAAITFPHGRQVERIGGRIFGPPGSDEKDAARWREAHEQHDIIIDQLRGQLGIRVTDRSGILNVPNDLPLVYASHPHDELVVDTAAEFSPGGAGSHG